MLKKIKKNPRMGEERSGGSKSTRLQIPAASEENKSDILARPNLKLGQLPVIRTNCRIEEEEENTSYVQGFVKSLGGPKSRRGGTAKTNWENLSQ